MRPPGQLRGLASRLPRRDVLCAMALVCVMAMGLTFQYLSLENLEVTQNLQHGHGHINRASLQRELQEYRQKHAADLLKGSPCIGLYAW